MLKLICALSLLVGGTVHAQGLKTYEIMDAQGFREPMVAYTIEVPQDWSVEGLIAWQKPCSGNDHFEMGLIARSPDGLTGYRIMPGYQILYYDVSPAGLDPDLAQMLVANNQAELNRLRTQFKGSNCYVAQVTGTQQLFENLVLKNRPQGAQVLKSEQNTQVMQLYQSMFGTAVQGVRNYFDATITAIGYQLDGNPIEEIVMFSWYAFLLDALPGVASSSSQHVVVDQIRIGWINPTRRVQDEAVLAGIVASLKVDPAWQKEIDDFYKKLASDRSKNNEEAARQREIQRQRDEASRDRQHRQFLDMITQ